MARGKKHMPEQIVSLLRQAEVAVANGKTTARCGRPCLRAWDERLNTHHVAEPVQPQPATASPAASSDGAGCCEIHR